LAKPVLLIPQDRFVGVRTLARTSWKESKCVQPGKNVGSVRNWRVFSVLNAKKSFAAIVLLQRIGWDEWLGTAFNNFSWQDLALPLVLQGRSYVR